MSAMDASAGWIYADSTSDTPRNCFVTLLLYPVFELPLEKVLGWLIDSDVHWLELVGCVDWKKAHDM